MRSERGQAALEWVGLVLLVCLACGAAVAAGAGAVDGRPLGAELARAIVCAARGGCDDGDEELVAAYGERDAALVRQYLPNLVYEPRTRTLPVDFRDCRSHRCSDAPDEERLDVHRTRRAEATVFTHLVRDGGETFVQYWLYYPDSTSTWMGSAAVWNLVLERTTRQDYPGHHPDDWESVQVRIDDRTGAARMRASSHGWYQGCKERECRNAWTPWTGWSRVSYGSHAGHIPLPARDPDERTTTAAGVTVVPIEGLTPAERAAEFEVTPPWEKRVYRDPRSDSTG